MIPYGRQNITEEDIQAVIDALCSDYLTQGPVVPDFERAVAEYCGAKYAVAVNSGTSGLHLACMAIGLGPGDILWTSPNTFVASANCALYCGADVDFVDIDIDTFNISIEALKKKLEVARKEKRLPKVVIPVHFAGQPCEMEVIKDLSEQYGFYIIEDATHALGSSYKGEMTGACKWSHMTVFSFHPVKMITTGEGGMLLTNDAELNRKIALHRCHGIVRRTEDMTSENRGGWYYEQIALGYNYRMTELQAALGLSQLERLDEFVSRRAGKAGYYNKMFSDLPVFSQIVVDGAISSWHLYVIRIDQTGPVRDRRYFYDELRKSGVGVNVHYIPVHLQPYYQRLGYKAGDYPEAEKYYEEALTLPLYPDLPAACQDLVISHVERIINQ